MAGRAWKGARFAHTLRVRLWREHLGMIPLDDRGARKKYADQFLEPCHRPGTDDYGRPVDMWWDYDLTDPVADDVWDDVVSYSTHSLGIRWPQYPRPSFDHLTAHYHQLKPPHLSPPLPLEDFSNSA